MINFVGQTEKLELDNSVIQDVTSTLIEDQEKIYKNLQDSIDSNNGRSFLLYGPNDSGKKEICLHLLKSLLKNSNSALVLCPTIEKSQLFFDRYKKFFNHNFTLMNSQFSKKEFQNKWSQINNLDSQIVVSTKFGFTLPIKNLKVLIISDADHFSYKQNFNLPKYDVREIAEYLSKKWILISGLMHIIKKLNALIFQVK